MLKTSFFILILALTSLEAALNDDVQISAGRTHTCALVNQKVFCWGGNITGLNNPPELLNPSRVSAGREHTCAIDDSGVKCWGDNTFGAVDVPQLNNPRQISKGGQPTCALDENGVKCWGHLRRYDVRGEIVGDKHFSKIVPPLKNPKMVTTGLYHACAIDDTGVKCWGVGFHGSLNVPPLRNPKLVSAANCHTCAIDDNGVKCWGSNEHGQTQIPRLKRPRSVSAGYNHACALDDEGVKCWGNNQYGQIHVPPLSNPRMVSAGGWHSCALDDDGMKCWGWKEKGQIDIPATVTAEIDAATKTVNFNIAHLEHNFSKLSRFVYRYKESFFKGIASEMASMPLDEKLAGNVQYRVTLARYTFLELAGPVLETTHSEIVENIYTSYLSYLPVLRKQMGINSLDDVELNAAVFKAVLSSSIYALKSSKEYLLVEEDAKEQEQMLSQLGALSSPNQAKEMLAVFNSHKRLIDSMTQNPRLNGFGALLEKVRVFLERKG